MRRPTYGYLYKELIKKGMLRTIWFDGRHLIKEYRFLTWLGDIRRPWARDHRCLTKLNECDVLAPMSYGVDRPTKEIIRHRREFVSGTQVRELDSEKQNALVTYLVAMHAAQVTNGDVSYDNLLITDDGRMLFIDFGRGRVFRYKSPLFYLNVGKELARIRRRLLTGEPSKWSSFLAQYIKTSQYPSWAWRIIWFSAQYWLRRWKGEEMQPMKEGLSA